MLFVYTGAVSTNLKPIPLASSDNRVDIDVDGKIITISHTASSAKVLVNHLFHNGRRHYL
ncbi:hypothetical protein BG74_03495 [Sodalis-like endosymbiont of Proechinophthirus fluctus]|uniref:hypothetical protein n=1 Tax=Sodalis-like endosymbiont of Proechinophthirus fluctus TaxID=1462730 RepID=UPI0007A8140D|nr:hypothetical protein [Sodalis-like endosymbiont of Proechinophthirus fluctus]KYP97356.1 hypothetical protein BG74_03495 [Sodalis-like endosymbiont of Proechinophthirus fluctus]